MKRADMEPGVLYAIERTHHNPRPGFVTDPGKPPGKVKARVYWSWPGSGDGDAWTPHAAIITKGRYDECEVGTGDVKCTWVEHVTALEARRAEQQATREAEEARIEAKRLDNMARVEEILPLLNERATSELVWAAKSNNMHATGRWTSAEVVALVEHVIAVIGEEA